MRTIDPHQSDAPELRLLRDVRREHAEPNPNTLDRMRHTVLNSTTYRDTAPNHRAARRRSRRTAVAIAGGALALAAALGSATLLPDHAAKAPGLAQQAGSTDTVTGLMTLAAQTASTTSPLNLRAGQVIYVRSNGHTTGSYQVGGGAKQGSSEKFVHTLEDSRNELWVEPEGMLTVRVNNTQGLSRKPLTPADAALAKQEGFNFNQPPTVLERPDPKNPNGCCLQQEYDKGKKSVETHGGSLLHPTAAYLAGLPTEPSAMLAVLRKEIGDQNKHTPDEQAFSAIMQLIREADPILPAAVRATLYRAIALIPGVSRSAGYVDVDGQQGIAIGRTDGTGFREEFILDVTGRHVIGFGTVQVTAENGIPAGTTSRETIEYRAVDKVGQTN
jgi:hypothetical protein